MKTLKRKISRSKQKHRLSHARIAMGMCIAGIVVIALVPVVQPAFAQGIAEQLVQMMKEKIGFVFSTNSPGFIFSKVTPNYTAYAGDRATAGGHRVMLALGQAEVEFSFLSAVEASASAQVATESANLTAADQMTLTLAEKILDRQATVSGSIVTVAVTVIRESGITPDERVLLAKASGILSAGTSQATGSADIILTQEQQDFLLLIQLKTRNITRSSQEINKDILGVIQEASDVLSKAKLEEDDKERRVVFRSIASGIDIAYRLNENGIVQLLSIDNRTRNTNIFTFALNTHGLTYKDVGHGVWYFSDRIGYVMRLAKAWATDENGAFTNDVITSIIQQDGKDVVTITVSPGWLAEASRVYPVTIHSSLEVVPELREGYLGAADARALRFKNSSLPIPTPTPTPKPVGTKSATPTTRLPAPERSDGGQATATPTSIITPTPVATDSGVLEGTPSGTPTEASNSSTVKP